MKTLYVHRPLLNAGVLARYAEAIGLQNVLLPVDMHVTVAYSKAPVDWTLPAFVPDEQTIIATGGKRRISRFGDAVVLEFQNAMISQRWANMVMSGASWDYPEYRPHVTLAMDPDAGVEGLIASTLDLRFGPERREALDETWEPKLKTGGSDDHRIAG